MTERPPRFTLHFAGEETRKPNGPDTFQPLWLQDIKPVLNAGDFVQGLLVSTSLIVVYGKHSSGKTFFTTTLALHVAAGKSFVGRRVDQGGVIYCVMEGGVGFQNRVAAWRDHHGLENFNVPFVAISDHLNMLDADTNLDHFIAAVHAIKAQMTVPLRLIVIDTLARALSTGNENNPDDMGALVMNADRLRRETGAAVLFVHHAGKDESRGARGHSSLPAAVDTEIEVTNDNGARLASVLKQRDLDSGASFPFSLQTIELGFNPYGEPVSTCLVVLEHAASAPVQHPTNLSGAAAIAMRALDIALSRNGAYLPPQPDYPPDTFAVSSDDWRQSCYDLKSGSQETNRKTFNRGQDLLIAKFLITQHNGYVWKVKANGTAEAGHTGTVRDKTGQTT